MTVDFVERGLPTKLPMKSDPASTESSRIACEMPSNMLRLGAPTSPWPARASILRLNVKDAGVGFTPSSSKRMAGLGLESMRERVQVLGGTFSVQSQPDGGTEINVEVSLPKT